MGAFVWHVVWLIGGQRKCGTLFGYVERDRSIFERFEMSIVNVAYFRWAFWGSRMARGHDPSVGQYGFCRGSRQ